MRITTGVRFMVIATLAFASMKVCVKYIPHIPAIEIVLFRSVISLIISLFFLLKQHVRIWGKNKIILILRGVTGAIALVTYFGLIQQIPLATVATLLYLTPIFSTILAIFLVKEKVYSAQWFFFLISFTGVWIITGFDSRISYLHLAMGIGSSLCSGLAYNCIRILKQTEHPLVIIFYFPLVALPIASIWSYHVWVTPSGWDWIFILLIGLFTQTGQYFLTRSIQIEQLSKVSIINYLGFVFLLLMGWILFDETFDFITYAGMLLVIVGVVANVLIKK